ncbi:MAG: tetratricopeptide repeat protein [Candidatus Latescibacter sp.]|nr:tetratricopeptide repeat protein [Candidatus Latescibacter sp.]
MKNITVYNRASQRFPVLAKVDVDANHELASQFGVRSIPTGKIFVNGTIVDEFIGALPESDIRAVIDSIVSGGTVDLLASAEKLSEESQFDEAESVFTDLLEREPGNTGAIIGLSRLKIIKGDVSGARQCLDAIKETDDRFEEAKTLMGALEFLNICKQHGGLKKSLKASEKNPGDLEALYILGCCYAAENSYGEALEMFLSIVRKNRQFGDDKARKAMLTLFAVIGSNSALTAEYRKRLAMEVF